MISEARKREKAANAFLAATMALSAAQSPKDFATLGAKAAPGVAIMQRTIGNPRKQRKNLDSGVVVPRNKKMKTFKEFVEEAYLYEMRKEDKVKGKQKTPMYLTQISKKAEKTPEGKWEVKKTEHQRPNPDAVIGRRRQGMTAAPGDTPIPGFGSEREQLRRHSQGGGSGARNNKPGEGRGVKRTQTIQQRRERPNWEPTVDSRTPAEKVRDKRLKAEPRVDPFSKKRTL
tara:strand:- start:10858 stop:11547 length:690 start_codon:yes stop_codon:yes gene_type:complete